MNSPKMVLFDYGQTIIAEQSRSFIKGNEAILKKAIRNPNNVKVEEIQEYINSLFHELCVLNNSEDQFHRTLEMTWNSFNRYVYEYFGIEFDVSYDELQWIFWTNSTAAKSSENIEQTLEFLYNNGIRTGVVSNIMYSREILARRINTLIPNNHFEFIIASSEYMFRKPYSKIFELALRKANLSAGEVWFCGDNLICDIEGAYNVGIQPVWYTKYAENTNIKNFSLLNSQYIKLDDWEELIKIISSL